MTDRIRYLKNLLTEEPQDPFVYYALGLEYIDQGSLEDALEMFSYLLDNHPDYLPVYYQAAHLMINMNNMLSAGNIFVAGIELAKKKLDHKTFLELSSAYQNFLEEHNDDLPGWQTDNRKSSD